MTTALRFTERAAPSASLRVDHDAGVIRGAKLCGIFSSNGRVYPLPVLTKARHLYEGARVNVDHPPSARNLDRAFADWAGVVENVQVRADGLYGDLRLRKSGAAYEALMEAAERFPDAFGLSHVADGDSRRVNGREEVTEINEVFSVDIVTDPATTGGLFESRQRRTMRDEIAENRRLTALLEARAEQLERDAAELEGINSSFAASSERAYRQLSLRRRRR